MFRTVTRERFYRTNFILTTFSLRTRVKKTIIFCYWIVHTMNICHMKKMKTKHARISSSISRAYGKMLEKNAPLSH